MSAKEKLTAFIDAIIAGDDSAEKTAFAEYTELKTQELLGLSAPVAEVNVVSTELTEEHKALLEAMLTDEIRLEGNTVYVKDKKVGRLEYVGKDEFGEGSTLTFLSQDGNRMTIKNNDIEDLVRVLRVKYLGEQP